MSGKAGHPAYFDPQTEKAYMKQAAVNASKKELIAKGNKKAPRYCLSRVPRLPALYPPPPPHAPQERGALSLRPARFGFGRLADAEQSVRCWVACGDEAGWHEMTSTGRPKVAHAVRRPCAVHSCSQHISDDSSVWP